MGPSAPFFDNAVTAGPFFWEIGNDANGFMADSGTMKFSQLPEPQSH